MSIKTWKPFKRPQKCLSASCGLFSSYRLVLILNVRRDLFTGPCEVYKSHFVFLNDKLYWKYIEMLKNWLDALAVSWVDCESACIFKLVGISKHKYFPHLFWYQSINNVHAHMNCLSNVWNVSYVKWFIYSFVPIKLSLFLYVCCVWVLD